MLISYKYFSYCNIKKHNNNLKFFIMKFLNMPAKRGFQIRNFWSIWGHSFRLNFIDFYDVVQLGNFCPRSPRLHTQNNISNSRVNLSEKQLLK